jgi:hypothetical protein
MRCIINILASISCTIGKAVLMVHKRPTACVQHGAVNGEHNAQPLPHMGSKCACTIVLFSGGKLERYQAAEHSIPPHTTPQPEIYSPNILANRWYSPNIFANILANRYTP